VDGFRGGPSLAFGWRHGTIYCVANDLSHGDAAFSGFHTDPSVAILVYQNLNSEPQTTHTLTIPAGAFVAANPALGRG
jgi:hypothetical protein